MMLMFLERFNKKEQVFTFDSNLKLCHVVDVFCCTLASCLGARLQGAGKVSRLLNLRFRWNNVDSLHALEQWSGSSLLQGYLMAHGSSHIRSTFALWT